MSVPQDLDSQLIQRGHVDELALVIIIVHLLHSVWVALSTAECAAGHWLMNLVLLLLSLDTIIEDRVLKVVMWMVCL